MRPIDEFRCRRLLCVLSLCLLTITTAMVLGGDVNKKREKDPAGERAAKMAEAIANRNTPPKIVKRRNYLPQYVPLYPKNYDWKEEDRVRNALDELEGDTSTELWEALVQKA